jgi:hypothetical protein
LFVGEVIFFGEALKGVGHFDGVEVFALDVFDEGDLHEAVIGEVLDDDGDLGEASDFGGAEAAFAGDELVVGAIAADDEGLNNAVFVNGLSEFGEAIFLEGGTGLEGIGLDGGDGDAEGRWLVLGLGPLLRLDRWLDGSGGTVGREEGGESSSECLTGMIRVIAHWGEPPSPGFL